jgi:hypothetical protein
VVTHLNSGSDAVYAEHPAATISRTDTACEGVGGLRLLVDSVGGRSAAGQGGTNRQRSMAGWRRAGAFRCGRELRDASLLIQLKKKKRPVRDLKK